LLPVPLFTPLLKGAVPSVALPVVVPLIALDGLVVPPAVWLSPAWTCDFAAARSDCDCARTVALSAVLMPEGLVMPELSMPPEALEGMPGVSAWAAGPRASASAVQPVRKASFAMMVSRQKNPDA
jgi:hypothetical protein